MNAIAKLKLSVWILAGVVVVFGIVSVRTIRSMNSSFDAAVNKSARKLQLGAEIDTIKSDMYVAQRGSVLASFMHDPARVSSLRTEFQANADKMKAKFEELRPLMSNAEGKRLLGVMQNAIEQWLREYQQVVRLCEADDPNAAQQHSFDKIAPIYKELATSAGKFVDTYRQELAEANKKAGDEYQQSVWMASILVLLSIGGAGWLMYMVRRLGKVLAGAAAEISKGSEQVAGAASQVSSSSQSLAQGASEQAASLEETSSSAEEITSMTHKNAENSASSAKVMAEMASRIEQGNRTLGDMVTSMNEISASSEKISHIIKTIDEIAFQTNILALNAAVEAARAGEAGMGFAVVADEVRNLAQRCAQAAKDTATLIEESVTKSHQGTQRLDAVAQAIAGITADADKVKTLVDEVHVGSQEQARGLEQISKAILQMEQVTQKSAASAEESAAAGEELNAQADTLRTVVGNLVALVGASRQKADAAALSLRASAEKPELSSRPVARVRVATPVVKPKPALVGKRPPAQDFPLDDSFQEM